MTDTNCRIKVGLMGGTFDPIHNGHLKLAEQALIQASLDKVLFIPSGCSYMKDTSSITGADKRLQMVQLAIKGHPEFEATDLEILREGNTYTCETLVELHHLHPDWDLYFIEGADSLFAMETWYHPEIIFQNACIIAAVREDAGHEQLERQADRLRELYQADILLLSMEKFDASSTDIRSRIRSGADTEELLPTDVLKYIEANALYR